MTDQQNTRRKNFEDAEKEKLVNIISLYQHIIENKSLDSPSIAIKQLTWKKVYNEYNFGNTEPCTLDKLQNQWKNLKRLTRVYCGELQQNSFQTGGGISSIKINPLYKKVRAIMHYQSAVGLHNPHDSDSIDANEFNENADPNLEIFSHSKENNNINDWAKNSTRLMKTPISTPLLEKIQGTSKNSCAVTKLNSLQLQSGIETFDLSDDFEIDDAEMVDLNGNRASTMEVPNSCSNKKSVGTKSKQNKDDLSEIKKKNLNEKHELELKILKSSLRKEELSVVEKELRIQILQHELQKRNMQKAIALKRSHN